MEMDYSNFNLDELTKMHKKEKRALMDALLEGATWEDVEDKKHAIIQLAIEIQKRKHLPGSGSPADTSFRG
jgi:hypothetical protein